MKQASPIVCVPICERTLAGLERALIEAEAIADVIELRLDCLDPFEVGDNFRHLEDLFRTCSRPTIITYRPAEQGGRRALDTKSRLKFWLFNRPQTENYLDMEFDLARNANLFDYGRTPDWDRVICSHHDLFGQNDLQKLYESMTQTPAGILKISVTAYDAIDCLPVFKLLQRAQTEGRKLIAVAMGEAGVATRILGPAWGSFLTYAPLKTNEATAAGQISARELRDLYRVVELDKQTEIFGLIGSPVSHSISPYLHNAALRATNRNAVYLSFEVRELAPFIKKMVHPITRELEWRLGGLSVTAPHKVAIMDHLDWIEPSAKEIGAINTVVVQDESLWGYNTDAEGFIEPLARELGSLQDLKVAILGCGGAARAAVWAVQNKGGHATVFARNQSKATAFAERFGIEHFDLAGAKFDQFDVVVNTTSLGTAGNLAELTPATADQLRGARVAYDLVYNPTETSFLREARAAGCKTISGLSMLVSQAALQHQLWTSEAPPEELMFQAIESWVK